ncbi:MAG: HlyC/CorC family transporter [Pararhodobacter sp.]|nr:HlyC/CorC family transporter [Pararhodobacter sp.]
MSDSDGGSSAAQRAQDPQDSGQRGLIGRIIDAFSPTDDADADATGVAVRALLPGLANLRRLRTEDVSIPKAEIVAVPVDIDRAGLIAAFRESGFSRLPVYEETLDRPLGLVLLKDLALRYGFNGADHAIDLRGLLRPLIFAPPSMPAAVLLQKMQTERIHMALVIDEYGGVDGLVTIEDLIEQVVGEISDEHDTEEEGYWTRETPLCYLAQARTPLEEFERELGLSLVPEGEEDEFDTLGGLIFVLAGRVPGRGEVIRHENGVEFEVIEADMRRIKRLRVRLPRALAVVPMASA